MAASCSPRPPVEPRSTCGAARQPLRVALPVLLDQREDLGRILIGPGVQLGDTVIEATRGTQLEDVAGAWLAGQLHGERLVTDLEPRDVENVGGWVEGRVGTGAGGLFDSDYLQAIRAAGDCRQPHLISLFRANN